MKVEQYIGKYLAGTLTESEMILFREMMGRSPEYRAELKQLLDLRSLMHDDSLRLTPPESLTERTRALMESRFALAAQARRASLSGAAADYAAGAPADPAIPNHTKRRGMPLPLRVSGMALTVFILGVITALTPTHPGGGQRPLAALAGRTGYGDDVTLYSGRATAVQPDPAPRTVVRRASMDRAHIPGTWSGTPAAQFPAPDGLTLPVVPAATNPVQNNAIPESRQGMPVNHINAPADAPDMAYNHIPDAASAYPPTGSAVVAASMSLPAGSVNTMDRGMAAESLRPHLAFGAVMGSGFTSEDRQLTAQMQSSFYLTVALNNTDRVGIEAGFSQLGTSTTVGVSKRGAFSKGTPDTDSQQPADNGNGSAAKNPGQKLTAPQISYGGVYYDRRFALNRSWDVCARAGIGGTDNALVASARVYAAYSPSANLKLTVGLGGSGLRTFDKGAQTSGNLGVYYGLEAGF